MIPGFQEMTLPLLKLAADGQPHELVDARRELAKLLGLSEADQAEKLPSGRQGRFANRVAWAKIYLDRAGLIESPAKGRFRITQRGLDVLKSPPLRIDIPFMEQFPEFQEFRSRRRAPAAPRSRPEEDESTPLEEMEAADEQLRAQLADELLLIVRRLSPKGFEQLVIELLIAMGYGGGRAESGSVTRAVADEGIDGLINEDRLGLGVIYVQAKCWEQPVGRPEIQKFVGALHGKRARKGVFITTSRFSPDAQAYVEHIEPRVVLIDGERLARLMIDHGVGVTTVQTFHVRSIDSDYFAEE